MFKELRRKDRMMDNESAIELLRSSEYECSFHYGRKWLPLWRLNIYINFEEFKAQVAVVAIKIKHKKYRINHLNLGT